MTKSGAEKIAVSGNKTGNIPGDVAKGVIVDIIDFHGFYALSGRFPFTRSIFAPSLCASNNESNTRREFDLEV